MLLTERLAWLARHYDRRAWPAHFRHAYTCQLRVWVVRLWRVLTLLTVSMLLRVSKVRVLLCCTIARSSVSAAC